MLKVLLMSAAAAALVLTVVPAMAKTGDSGLKVIDQIKVGGAGGWDYAAFDTATGKVYIAHGTGISVVDTVAKTANAHLADAQGAHIALPFNNGKSLLITQGKANAVTINDAATGAVTATIATDTGPDGAIIDSSTGYAFVMANHGGMVDVIDLASPKLLGKIVAGGAPEGVDVDGKGLVFTHLEDKNAIVVIDAKAMKVNATYAMNDCDGPTGIAFVEPGRLLLSACHNGVARVTNADTGAEVAALPIGQRPDFALYDAERKLGYIPCGDGTLSVISFDGKPHVIDVVATKTSARTATLDPKTGTIYLPAADSLPPAKPGDRPAMVPDSFEIVVVGKGS